MSIVNIKKDEILKRSKNRITKVEVNNFSNNNSFTTSLSPLESLELVSKISRESFYLETGIIPADRVDKKVFKISTRDY